MKIVYIGANDFLTETLVRRMGQEGHDVYLLSDKTFVRKTDTFLWHRFYRIPRRGESFRKLLGSIVPDCIIFAGKYYIDCHGEDKSNEDINMLSQSLQTAAELPDVKFILLSDTQVCDNDRGKSLSGRGIKFLRQEELLRIYKKQYGIKATVLRASQLYTDRTKEHSSDFLSQCFSDALSQKKESRKNDIYQPIHVSDFVDAIKKAVDSEKQQTYDVCGSAEISAKRLDELICRQENIPAHEMWEEADRVDWTDNSRIKEDLGWNDIRNLEGLFLKGEIKYERSSTKTKQKKSFNTPANVRQVIENLLIFVYFLAFNSAFGSNSIFSKVDWLIVYVIIISVAYNTYYSVLATLLASGAYLFMNNLSILEIRNFYSYAGSVLTIMEYVFVGLIVSYTITTIREELHQKCLDLDLLKEEYEDLKAINEENVLIKNEYERRILTSKTGFPKLYSMVSRLMADEPERILMEIMEIIAELVRTDTVAVYRGHVDKDNSRLRLVNALNDRSAMDGKTWNLSDVPRVYDAVMRGEFYQGEIGSKEPSVVIPIFCHGVSEAVIIIKKLPYECETLYHVNLLKTLSLLLRDSMEKALQYEKLSREESYVKGTEVLKAEAFGKRVLLAEEKAQKSFAEYCVIEIVFSGGLEETAEVVGKELRVTDCLGTDGEGGLFALLSNTSPGNLGYVQKRLVPCGVEIRNTSHWEVG